MTERPVGVTDQAAGAGVAEVRTRERSVGGNTVAEQYVIPISERVASYKGFAASFRTLGLTTTPHNVFSIENAAGSTVLLAVRRLTVQMDSTVAFTTVAPSFKTSRPAALPTGGTTLTKVAFDSSLTSSASVVLRGATASDGGAATAITATAGSTGWTQLQMRMSTVVGQIIMDDATLIPALCDTDPVILRAGEALLAQVVLAALATHHYVVNCMWEEFSLP